MAMIPDVCIAATLGGAHRAHPQGGDGREEVRFAPTEGMP